LGKCDCEARKRKNYILIDKAPYTERTIYTSRCKNKKCRKFFLKVNFRNKESGDALRKEYRGKEAERVYLVLKPEIIDTLVKYREPKPELAKGYLYLEGKDGTIKNFNDRIEDHFESEIKTSRI
jgi:hypothetical protein